MTRAIVAVIVNYNTGRLLRQAVDSVLAQAEVTGVAVVDNASSDRSAGFLSVEAAYRDQVSVTVNARNLGFARANNQIIEQRAADYYLLMNPDCVLDMGAVGELAAHLDANPDIGLAGGALRNPDGTLQKTSKRAFPTPWSALARTLGLHRIPVGSGPMADFDLAREAADSQGMELSEAVSGALMLVRGAALADVGLLDEGYFMHCEDLDWCKRFWDAGYQVAYVPAAGAVHHKGASGRGPRVIWHLHRGMIRFYNKHYRREHSLAFSALVYAAVCARGALLAMLSLVPGRP